MLANNNKPIAQVLKSFKREFLAVVFFSFVSNLLMLTPTIYMMQIYDRVMISHNEMSLIAITIIMVIFFMAMSFSDYIRSRILVRSGVRLDMQLNSRLFKQNFKAYIKSTTIDPNEAFSSLTNLRQFLTGNGILAALDTPWTPIYIAISFLLHPALGMLALACCILQLILAVYNHNKVDELGKNASESSALSNTYLFNKIRNGESAEAMGMVSSLRQKWQLINHNALKQNLKFFNKQTAVQGANKVIRQIMQSCSLALGAWLAVKGEISMGSMIAANVLVSRALAPVDMLVVSYKQFHQAKTSYDYLNHFLENDSQAKSSLGHFKKLVGKIVIKNLTVKVESKNQPILSNINLTFEPGKMYAILGHSGSGKSTLARCILGIWPGVEAQVELDAVPIEQWNRQMLGPYIGYLPQDIELFEGTVAENISRFEAVDSNKVIQAAKATGIHETILRLPYGYDTQLDQIASLLSGGQKQRLGLARAVYGEPTVIVLDEPNANLDDAGEAALARCVDQMKQAGKTILFIAHRGSIINLADEIIVLEQGQVKMAGEARQVIKALSPSK